VRRVAAVAFTLLLAACTRSPDMSRRAEGGAATTTTPTTELATTTSSAAPPTVTTASTAPPSPTTSATPPVPPAAPGSVPAAGGACAVPAGYPEPWPDRPRYTVRLALDPAVRRLTGSLQARFVPEAPTDRLVFRLWANAPRLGRAGSRFEITAAFLGDQLVAGAYEAGGAMAGSPGTIFALPGSFAAGRPVSARLEFRLFLPGAVNDRVAQAGSAFRLGSVLPTLSWLRGEGWQTSPAVDAFAEAAASEVADYDVTVAAPAGYTVLATGEQVEPNRFVATAVRDWAATAAPMRVAETTAQGGRTPVVVGVAEGSGDDPAALARRVADALDRLAARFGEYPYPRLTMGVTAGLSGGIEFPMHIFLGSGVSSIHLVHEVAHEWFYGVAGNDQFRDPWLDEGLATYGEARLTGRLASQRARPIPAAGRGHVGESMAYWRSHPGAYFRSVYVGGLQVLGALADRLGGYDVLDCGLRRYHRDRAYTVSRPGDLFDAIQRQTGLDPRPVVAPFGVR
jgi:peptidase M1-like protein